jgi:hypothetical protein
MMTKMLAGAAGIAAIAAAAPAAAQYYQSNPYATQYGTNGYSGYNNGYTNGYTGYNNTYNNGYTGYGYNNGYTGYGYNNNGYTNRAYGYAAPTYGANATVAQQQCSAAVQSRLYNRTSIGSILGSMIGLNTNTSGRVLSVTQIAPRGNGELRVRGLASSGRYAQNNYSPYGVGAYGALGYGYNNAADLSWSCNVTPAGYVRSVHISRR